MAGIKYIYKICVCSSCVSWGGRGEEMPQVWYSTLPVFAFEGVHAKHAKPIVGIRV